jgi:hypothetical protein
MNNIVYYLSFFSELNGFLFPDELPKNYYAPGLFLVEPEANGSYPYGYSFDAMDNGRRVSLKLIRVDENNSRSSLFVVKTRHYGSFWFNLEKINPSFRYKGSRSLLHNHNDFCVAMTTDHDKLERVCRNFNFYFIGSTLRESLASE